MDNYEQIIKKAFEEQPNADMIVFNVPCDEKCGKKNYKILKNKKLNKFSCLRYGTYRFVFKLGSIRKANIYFSLLFGGGARYSCGEDSLFIMECIRKGLNVYSNTSVIGYVSHTKSTWFKGYNEKFFIDKGVLYTYLFTRLTNLFLIQFILRHKKIYSEKIGRKEALKLMKKGKKIAKEDL